jgi:hypothetical protein
LVKRERTLAKKRGGGGSSRNMPENNIKIKGKIKEK